MDDHNTLHGLNGPAVEQLLARYEGMMAYIVRGILADPHEAEDCLAQVRARIWEKAALYDGEKASLATWVTAICRNAAYDRLRALERRSRQTRELSPDTPDPAPGPEEEVLRRERAQALQNVLNTLGRRDHDLFYRKYYYLQSTQRIADELGTTPKAVEGRLYRIRKKLQKQLGGDVL